MDNRKIAQARREAFDPGVRSVRLKVLGVTVTPMTALETVQWVTQQSGKRLLLNHNMHSAYLYETRADFRRFYARAARVVIDGAPILWLARRSGPEGLNASYRIGSTDWLAKLAEAPIPGRLFVYGATEESNRDAVSKLRGELSGKGWYVEGKHGYVNRAEAIEWLQRGEPTLVIVGLGMPLQEEFLEEVWDQLPDAVYATVGGAIDYVAGHNSLAPRWMGPLGVEWLWRLASDPRRLAHRYLAEPLKFARVLLRNRRRGSHHRTPGAGQDFA